MNRIPCKKCPQCGLFNDFTVEECECGKKLDNVGAQFIDTDKLSLAQYGEINTSLKVYIQKCSACGALNYTDNPDTPVKVCYNCHKTRVAAIVPCEYIEESNGEKIEISISRIGKIFDEKKYTAQQRENQVVQGKQSFARDDDNDDFVRWQAILKNIEKAVGIESNVSNEKLGQQGAQKNEEKAVPIQSNFDDNAEIRDWPDILDSPSNENSAFTSSQQIVSSSVKKDITLTAIRYGRFSFTVKAGSDKYMLGRSAKQSDFLSQDSRVGNEHCYLFYQDGEWFIRDNNSKNGTAVNSKDIGLNGECMLSDGDEIKLGHHPDSIIFRITIN